MYYFQFCHCKPDICLKSPRQEIEYFETACIKEFNLWSNRNVENSLTLCALIYQGRGGFLPSQTSNHDIKWVKIGVVQHMWCSKGQAKNH